MLSIVFHFRSSLRPEVKEGRIFARLIYHRQSGNITLPYQIRISEWDEQAKELIVHPQDEQRANYLENVRREMQIVKRELTNLVSEFEEKGEFTVSQLLNCYRFRRQGRGLTGWVKILSDELQDAGCERTARAYRTTLVSFLSFCGKEDLYPEELTEELIVGYERSLRQRKRSLNTISFYMRNLRAICNKGIHRGMFTVSSVNLFTKVYTKVAVSRKRALSKTEMKSLENLLSDPVIPPSEADALRLFMFAFHARGMSFVDMAYLKKEDINRHSGTLTYFRRKTGQFIEMKINASMSKIIDHYMNVNIHSPYLFPVIRTGSKSSYVQYCTGLRIQNQRLKRLAIRARVKGGLSTHQARHAWATIAKKENIPIWVISEGLGHTSVTTTYIYLDSFGSSVLDRAHQKISQAISKIN